MPRVSLAGKGIKKKKKRRKNKKAVFLFCSPWPKEKQLTTTLQASSRFSAVLFKVFFIAFVGSHRWPWHLKAVGCTPTHPTLVFWRRRPRDRGNGSIRAHTAAVRLIASTAPDGEESGAEREREREGDRKKQSSREDLNKISVLLTPSPDAAGTPWTAMAGPKMSCSPPASWTSPGRRATSR